MTGKKKELAINDHRNSLSSRTAFQEIEKDGLLDQKAENQ